MNMYMGMIFVLDEPIWDYQLQSRCFSDEWIEKNESEGGD